ncbi:MAG: DUF2339 domain-containing protein [Bdellovibrionota bacterium]
MENEQLSRELQELKNRLTRIEEKLGVGTENLVSSEDRTKSKPPEQEFPLLIKKAKSQSAPKRDSNLLGAVGVFFFILAASFFIKLAIDSGWLTPLRQFTGAVIFGCSLIALGFKLKKRDLEYSALLPGAGVVVLFMSAYAGHLYYQLYSSSIAIFLAAAISLLSLYLFTFFAYELFLVVAIVGTYLVPLLISDVSASLAGICLYFLFWAVLYCLCAIYLKRRLLISVASYFAIVVFQFALFEVVKLPQTGELELGDPSSSHPIRFIFRSHIFILRTLETRTYVWRSLVIIPSLIYFLWL